MPRRSCSESATSTCATPATPAAEAAAPLSAISSVTCGARAAASARGWGQAEGVGRGYAVTHSGSGGGALLAWWRPVHVRACAGYYCLPLPGRAGCARTHRPAEPPRGGDGAERAIGHGRTRRLAQHLRASSGGVRVPSG